LLLVDIRHFWIIFENHFFSGLSVVNFQLNTLMEFNQLDGYFSFIPSVDEIMSWVYRDGCFMVGSNLSFSSKLP
jgi:hypothetical protein